MADVIVDTSNLTVHELRDVFGRMTRDESARADMVVNLLSFGFKHGAPAEADLVFDVRCLPNPHFVDRLRHLTGRDAKVVRFMRAAQGHAGVHRSPDGVPEVRAAALRDRRQELSDRCDRLYRGAASIGHDRRGAQTVAGAHAGRKAARQTSRWMRYGSVRDLMIGVVVVTHGQLATELVNAAETIVGDMPGFAAVSIGWHEDTEDARHEIEQAVARVEKGAGRTDPDRHVRRHAVESGDVVPRRRGKLEVITGVNLPMLIKLANLPEQARSAHGRARHPGAGAQCDLGGVRSLAGRKDVV